jgi:hypothetical protein
MAWVVQDLVAAMIVVVDFQLKKIEVHVAMHPIQKREVHYWQGQECLKEVKLDPLSKGTTQKD